MEGVIKFYLKRGDDQYTLPWKVESISEHSMNVQVLLPDYLGEQSPLR